MTLTVFILTGVRLLGRSTIRSLISASDRFIHFDGVLRNSSKWITDPQLHEWIETLHSTTNIKRDADIANALVRDNLDQIYTRHWLQSQNPLGPKSSKSSKSSKSILIKVIESMVPAVLQQLQQLHQPQSDIHIYHLNELPFPSEQTRQVLCSEFDHEYYAKTNPDLRSNNSEALFRHWMFNGYRQKRPFRWGNLSNQFLSSFPPSSLSSLSSLSSSSPSLPQYFNWIWLKLQLAQQKSEMHAEDYWKIFLADIPTRSIDISQAFMQRTVILQDSSAQPPNSWRQIPGFQIFDYRELHGGKFNNEDDNYLGLESTNNLSLVYHCPDDIDLLNTIARFFKTKGYITIYMSKKTCNN